MAGKIDIFEPRNSIAEAGRFMTTWWKSGRVGTSSPRFWDSEASVLTIWSTNSLPSKL